MRLGFVGGIVAALVVIALFVAYGSLFTVHQTRHALKVRLGQVVAIYSQPGLHVKWPLIDNIIHIDKRILDLEAPAQEVIASDQKRLVVDAFARYRIIEPAQVLSDGRIDRGREPAAVDLAGLGTSPGARRGDLHPGGA